jgi:hypothetical protein
MRSESYCIDPSCVDSSGRRSVAEQEVDGDCSYYECPECGYVFGWERTVSTNAGACVMGVPENLRRKYNIPLG